MARPKSMLKFEPLPPSTRQGTSEYVTIMDEFVSSGEPSARVVLDKKAATVYQSLSKLAKTYPQYNSVKVVRRGEDVWLATK